jgi:two-component system sensor histidine kinase/response regulator
LGRGSTFWFTAVFERYGAIEDVEPEVALEAQQSGSGDFRGMRILVGASSGAEEMWKTLETLSCSTGAISSARAIVTELRRAAQSGTPYHAALLDLEMPGFDTSLGIEVAEDADVFNTALIAMTSEPNPAVDAALRERGFRTCMEKPVRRADLHRALSDVWQAETAESGAAAYPAGFDKPILPRIDDEAEERQPRVLLAEDNLVNQTIVLRLLEKASLKADVVANGFQAVSAASRTAYDLILMDCQMPEMDGFEATAEIRRMEGDRRHTTICALTAHAMAGDRDRCLQAGMDDYISKPLTIGVLHKKIAYWIYSKQRHSEGQPA